MAAVDTRMTIPRMVAESAKKYSDQAAVVDGELRLSYSELATGVSDVARAYTASGVRRGDRVAVWAPNRAEFILAVLGAQTVGASVVPVNTRYRGHEAMTILSRSRASALVLANGFLNTDFVGMLRSAAVEDGPEAGGGPVPGLPLLRTVVDMAGEHATDGVLAWRDFMALGKAVSDEEIEELATAVTPDDISDILFTSGTTGVPKGVMTAHHQTLDIARVWGQRAGLSTADNFAIVNPFFHGFGYKAGMITSIVYGCTIYPVAVFKAEKLLELIQTARISVLPGAPTIFTSLLDHPRLSEYDTSSLRFSVAGAATVPRALFKRMLDELGFSSVGQAYGLTEALLVTQSRPNEDPAHIAETTGPPVEGMAVRIIDPAGDDVPVGTEGEVLIGGTNVMLGYFEDPEATRRAIDSDNWLHSGDIGKLDEHGCLSITDRLKDMFTVGGFNVYPAEVENVLATHPDVSESAVVAKADDRMGSVGLAFVVARPGSTVAEGDLIAHCKKRLANFKVPREIAVRDELPKNAAGKILKKDLRGMVKNG